MQSLRNAKNTVYSPRFGERRNLVVGLFLLWERPLWAALLAFFCYAIVTSLHGDIFGQSTQPYYAYLADSFLHGQLNLRDLPLGEDHDLVFYQGKYYLYWAPMPAILMMPIVLIFGRDFSDVFFTLLLGGLNVGLVAWLLQAACGRNIIRISRLQRSILVFVFALGSVHAMLAPFGRVWFTAQLIAFGFTALTFLSALRLKGAWAFFCTGLAVSCAMLTRSHTMFIGIWLAYYLLQQYYRQGWRILLRYTLIGLLPFLMAGVLGVAGYNLVRFGSPFDVGLDYHQMGPAFQADYEQYGAFNLHYLPTNFYYQYISYPFPQRSDSYMGGSLFLMTPVFFAAFMGLYRGRRRASTWFLLMTLMMINIPILLLMGTGWIQWGPRYTLDFTIPLLLLTALGLRRWPDSILALLAGISAVHYYGMATKFFP